jgi:DNA-binding response OmpR family regulator
MGQSRILIIDDDPDISEAMRVVLENAGFSVDYAEDGNKGLGQMKSARPDLIILDVMMNTSQEGFVVSRTIKNNPDYKDIPIVMLTAVK